MRRVPGWLLLWALPTVAAACALAAVGLPVLAGGLLLAEAAVGLVLLGARRGSR